LTTCSFSTLTPMAHSLTQTEAAFYADGHTDCYQF
jgi:hypothetical protein